MASTLAPSPQPAAPSEAQEPEVPRGGRPWATLAAVGAVLIWFALQLGRFIGEPPDLDSMISLRESLVVHDGGLGALIDARAEGVHPPVMDFLASLAFTLFGEDWRSVGIVAILLFAVLAAATERLLAPYVQSAVLRVLGALAVAVCPSIALTTFVMQREGLMMVGLVVALALLLAPGGGWRRRLAAGCVLALLPLIKETGLIVAGPFGLYAFLVGAPGLKARVIRGATVLGPVAVAAGGWKLAMEITDSKPWESWLLTPNADEGAVGVGINALLGQEDGLFLRQNLANGLFVNWLWLPTALALVTLVLCLRPSAPKRLRQAVALVLGVGVVYAWSTLTFPTYTIPRYATPLTLMVIVLALLGMALWPRRLRPVVPALLIAAFVAGAWSPTDPWTKDRFGTVSIGGEEIYDTTEVNRGPDRMQINFSMLQATASLNDRLREIYASEATLVTGDCFTLKAGEKLYSIGLRPGAYDRAFPGARPLACVPVDQLDPAVLQGPPGTVALLRTPEEIAAGYPPAVQGPAVFVVS